MYDRFFLTPAIFCVRLGSEQKLLKQTSSTHLHENIDRVCFSPSPEHGKGCEGDG
jgi:hypothetical protein